MPYEDLDKSRITGALCRLGELAVEAGTLLEVSLYGGAVFTIVYGSRDSTKDIDAVVRPSDLAQKFAAQVAHEQELPEDWLNDDVRYFLSEKRPNEGFRGMSLARDCKSPFQPPRIWWR